MSRPQHLTVAPHGTHQLPWQQGVHPVIENRKLWKQDLERMLPGHDGNFNIVHDEVGTVYCYDKVSEPPVRHKMAYLGHAAFAPLLTAAPRHGTKTLGKQG